MANGEDRDMNEKCKSIPILTFLLADFRRLEQRGNSFAS